MIDTIEVLTSAQYVYKRNRVSKECNARVGLWNFPPPNRQDFNQRLKGKFMTKKNIKKRLINDYSLMLQNIE